MVSDETSPAAADEQGAGASPDADRGAPEQSELGRALALLDPIVDGFRERLLNRLLQPRRDALMSFLDDFRTQALAGLERIEKTARDAGFDAAETRELVRGVRSDLFGWLARAVELTVRSQQRGVSRAQLLKALTRLDGGLKSLPQLSLLLEDERFGAAPDDSGAVRLLKAWRRSRRALGSLVGRQARSRRELSLAELGAHYVGRPLGDELRVANNVISVMRVDLWRGSRIVVEQLETAYRFALGRLEGESPSLEKLVSVRREVAAEIDLAKQNLAATEESIEHRLERRLREIRSEINQAARVAGTWELPNRAYPYGRSVEARSRVRDTIARNKENWDRIVAATASALVMRLRAESVLGRFDELSVRCSTGLREGALSPVREYPDEVAEQLEEARRELSALIESAPGAEALAARLAEEQTLLEGFITRIVVGEMASAIDPGALGRPFDALYEGLDELLHDLPDSFELRLDPWSELPAEDPADSVTRIVAFPFAALCRAVLRDEVRLRLSDRQRTLGLLLREVADELTEIAHFVAFAFEGGSKALLDDKPELLTDLLLGGLDEARARTQRLVESAGSRAQALLEELAAISAEQGRELRRILAKVDLAEARRRVGRVGAVAETIADGAGAADAADEGPAVGLAGRMRERIRAMGDWARAQLGFSKAGPLELDSHGVAGLDPVDERTLPRSYRRLFETAAFGVEDVLAGQQAELEQLAAAVDRWRAGRPTSVAIVGERGAGRTTMVERGLRRLLADVTVKRRTLVGRVATEDGLALELSQLVFAREEDDLGRVRRMLEQHSEPMVVVLEGLQQVLLRTYDGLDPLVRLLNIISRSGADLLWLVSVDAAAWGFMDTFLEASDHFTHVVELGRLTREQTEQLIMHRHRISGLGLAFQPQSSASPSTPLPLEGARRQRYFDSLQKVAGGHPVSTLFAWLDAVLEVTEDGVVVLGPPRDVGRTLGDQLPIDRLINLAALMMHGSLTETELAQVGRMNPRHAAALLAQLQAANLVESSPGAADRFVVNPILYRPLFERLRRRRMI